MRFRGTLLIPLAILLAACDDGTGAGDAVVDVEITAPGDYLDVGQSAAWEAIARGTTGAALARADVAWSSSDPAVAEVVGGQVTGRAPGTAYIRASVAGMSDSALVTVETPVASLVVWPADSIRIIQGREAPLLIEMRDASGRAITHSLEIATSSSATVAVRDRALSGIALGSATVSVRAGIRSVQLPVEVVTGKGYTVRSFDSFDPRSINDFGWVAGQSQGQAAIWRNGVVTPLPHDGFVSSVAQAVNDSGMVAGVGVPVGDSTPVLWTWRAGVVQRVPLGTSPGVTGQIGTIAVEDMNDRGEIIGSVRMRGEALAVTYFHWTGSGVEWHPKELSLSGINDQGVIIGSRTGTSVSGGVSSTAVLLDGTLRDIPKSLPSTGYWVGLDINNRGQYVGMFGEGCYSGFTGDVVSTTATAPPAASCRVLTHINEYMDMTGAYNGIGDLDTRARLIRNGEAIDITAPGFPSPGSGILDLNNPGQLILYMQRSPQSTFLVTPAS